MSDGRLHRVIEEIERYFGSRLVAAALFGSRVGGRPRTDSDWDLLLILDANEPLRRSLYREWDDGPSRIVGGILAGVSAHFVHLPPADAEPTSIWLEVAMAHEILSDRTGLLAAHLDRVRKEIEHGRFERRSVHGLPYWVSSIVR